MRSRALERQLESSLEWRCCQTVALQPRGGRDRRRDADATAAVSGGSGSSTPEEADFGAAQLCRGLLEQCDLCADAVRALCAAVSPAACSLLFVDCETGAYLFCADPDEIGRPLATHPSLSREWVTVSWLVLEATLTVYRCCRSLSPGSSRQVESTFC